MRLQCSKQYFAGRGADNIATYWSKFVIFRKKKKLTQRQNESLSLCVVLKAGSMRSTTLWNATLYRCVNLCSSFEAMGWIRLQGG